MTGMPDTQDTLPGLGRHGGIWARYLTAGCVDDGAWRNAIATLQHVGTCRRPGCGGLLRPGVPYELPGGRWQYPAVCSAPSCGRETVAHGPRPEKTKKG